MSKQKVIRWDYLIRKLKKLFYPFIFCFIAFILVYGLVSPWKINTELIIDLVTFTIPSTTTWFYKVIIAIYIFTFLLFKTKISAKGRVCVTWIAVIIYIYMGHRYLPQFWYASILCYPLGQTFAIVERKNILYYICLIILLLFSIFTIVFDRYYLIPLCMLFSVASIGVVRGISIGCRFLDFIGKESLLFYLFQMLFLNIGTDIGLSTNWIVYGLFVFVSTYLLALFYHVIALKLK